MPGYQEGGEPMWWWKAAMHLDEAQLSLTNAMAHNVDDPRLAHALYDRLREGQAILLEIFRAKGLLPAAANGRIEVPMPEIPTAKVPMPGMPGVPTSVLLPFPPAGGEAATAVPTMDPTPTTDAEQSSPLAAEERGFPVAAPHPEPEPPPEATTAATLADPGAVGAGG